MERSLFFFPNPQSLIPNPFFYLYLSHISDFLYIYFISRIRHNPTTANIHIYGNVFARIALSSTLS